MKLLWNELFQLLIIFAKNSVLDVWLGTEYASVEAL